ncbi:MAG: tetratricopeptide repeat protein, partial [Alphaproteobacteria bacterium]
LSAYADKILTLDPNNIIGLHLRAVYLRRQGNLEQAAQLCRQGIALHQQNDQLWVTLGMIKLHQGDSQQAVRCFETARAVNRHNQAAMINLGITHYDLGNDSRALLAIDQISRHHSEFFAAACYARAQLYLRSGKYDLGWQYYEQRWDSYFFPGKILKYCQKHMLKPAATPDQLSGKRIVIYTEQGHGDNMMMVRLLPLLKQEVAQLILVNFHGALTPYFKALPALEMDIIHVNMDNNIEDPKAFSDHLNAVLPAYDVHCSMMSLPYLLRIDQHKIPPPLNYQLPLDLRQKWYDQVKNWRGDNPDARIFGLVASGNPAAKDMEARNIPITHFKGCFKPTDRIIILQKSLDDAQRSFVDEHSNFIFAGDLLENFADSAAAISMMDAVISVDSGVAHLAGSMRAKLAILLPKPAEWRWQENTDTTPWYEIAVLIRQQKQGNWHGAINRLQSFIDETMVKRIHPPMPHLLDLAITALAQQAPNQAPAQAIDYATQLLILYPNHGLGLQVLAVANANLGRQDIAHYKVAFENFAKACQQRPMQKTWRNQALRCADLMIPALFEAQNYDESLYYCQQRIKLDPEDVNSLKFAIGLIRQYHGNHQMRLFQALHYCKHLLKAAPDDPQSYAENGLTYAKLYDWKKAAENFKRALDIAPHDTYYLASYCTSLMELGQFEQAFPLLRNGIENEDPPNDEHQFSYGVCLLTLGHYRQGWRLYEYRVTKRRPDLYQTARWAKALEGYEWDGKQSLKGKILVLIAEQGHGDNIMFARFIPLLIKRGVTLKIIATQPLVSLFSSLAGIDKISDRAEDVTAGFDYFCLFGSLPHKLNIDLKTLPPPIDFRVDGDFTKAWQHKVKARISPQFNPRINKKYLKVGFVYQGSANHGKDGFRSFKYSDFLSLKQRIEQNTAQPILWVCLQNHISAKDHIKLSRHDDVVLLDDLITDFKDCAAIIKGLDHVITIDSAIAHLSGSLGVKTQLFITDPPDFRWLLDRPDSPWYPSITLHRHPISAGWKFEPDLRLT